MAENGREEVKQLLIEQDVKQGERFSSLEGNLGSKLDSLGEKLDKLTEILAGNLVNNSAAASEDEEDAVEEAEVSYAGVNQEPSLIDRAAREQDRAGDFVPDDVYMTLVNPFVRTKKELTEYGDLAEEIYRLGEFESIQNAFKEDFQHWAETHFRCLHKPTVVSIREMLLKEGAQVRKQAGL